MDSLHAAIRIPDDFGGEAHSLDLPMHQKGVVDMAFADLLRRGGDLASLGIAIAKTRYVRIVDEVLFLDIAFTSTEDTPLDESPFPRLAQLALSFERSMQTFGFTPGAIVISKTASIPENVFTIVEAQPYRKLESKVPDELDEQTLVLLLRSQGALLYKENGATRKRTV